MTEIGTEIENKGEMGKYSVETYVSNFDILSWWRLNERWFPCPARFAMDLLAVPVSTVTSLSAFIDGGRVLDHFHRSLSPLMAESFICKKLLLRSSTNSIDIEEYLCDINKIEGNRLQFLLYYVTCMSFVYIC